MRATVLTSTPSRSSQCRRRSWTDRRFGRVGSLTQLPHQQRVRTATREQGHAIVLIAPTALDMAGRPVKQRRVYLPGLTLQMLAAVTPPDVDLRLVNETAEDVPFDKPWDLVGLTGMGSGIVRAWQIADEFRRRGRTVVIGGIAASLADPEWTLAHADSLVVGEAEELWPRVIDDARRGRLQRVYRMERPPDIKTLPLPRYELMKPSKYGPWSPVQATRGCPFTCTFCSITAFFHQGYRNAPSARCCATCAPGQAHPRLALRRLHRRQHRRRLGLLPRTVAALIPEKIVWMSQCSLHIADRPDMLALARRSGCQLLSFGIESTNPASLASIDKEWNRPSTTPRRCGRFGHHGIDVSTEMIIGLDDDDASVFEPDLRLRDGKPHFGAAGTHPDAGAGDAAVPRDAGPGADRVGRTSGGTAAGRWSSGRAASTRPTCKPATGSCTSGCSPGAPSGTASAATAPGWGPTCGPSSSG